MVKNFLVLGLFIFMFMWFPSSAFAANPSNDNLVVLIAQSDYQGASEWAVSDLDKAAQYGLITDSIKANMNQPITREEFAEIAVRLYERSTDSVVPILEQNIFADTNNPEVLKAYTLGIVTGTNQEKRLFSPGELTNREQVAAMLYRTFKAIGYNPIFSGTASQFNDGAKISAYATEAVAYMSSQGFIKGYGGNFDPRGTCTREMAVLIATRVYEDAPKIEAQAQAAEDAENAKADAEADNPRLVLPVPNPNTPSELAKMVPYMSDAYVCYLDEWDGGDGDVMYTTDYSIADIIKFYTDITNYQNGTSAHLIDNGDDKTVEVYTNNRHILISVMKNTGTDFPKANIVGIGVFWYMPV